ncbi:Uncharacterised protein [Mycobacteroides abscessus subsp. abscessus]|nr:Uncharacterised protein [Mycobacteroides abscessus subsp. abscessus]
MSPISGALQMASQLNKFLLYTIVISLTATILLSWVLSKKRGTIMLISKTPSLMK